MTDAANPTLTPLLAPPDQQQDHEAQQLEKRTNRTIDIIISGCYLGMAIYPAYLGYGLGATFATEESLQTALLPNIFTVQLFSATMFFSANIAYKLATLHLAYRLGWPWSFMVGCATYEFTMLFLETSLINDAIGLIGLLFPPLIGGPLGIGLGWAGWRCMGANPAFKATIEARYIILKQLITQLHSTSLVSDNIPSLTRLVLLEALGSFFYCLPLTFLSAWVGKAFIESLPSALTSTADLWTSIITGGVFGASLSYLMAAYCFHIAVNTMRPPSLRSAAAPASASFTIEATEPDFAHRLHLTKIKITSFTIFTMLGNFAAGCMLWLSGITFITANLATWIIPAITFSGSVGLWKWVDNKVCPQQNHLPRSSLGSGNNVV